MQTNIVRFQKSQPNPPNPTSLYRTIGELEELQNARDRLNQSYTRLNTLLLKILEAQPIATNAMLDLLAKAIENGRANLEAANASTQEIKRGWNLS